MSTKKIIVFALILMVFSTILVLVYSYYSTSNLSKIIESSELVYVEDSSQFENYTYPIQIDNSLPNEIVPYKWNVFRPRKPIVSLVFNGYPTEVPYQRVYVFELSKKSFFSKEYQPFSRANIRIKNITFDEAITLVNEVDVRQKDKVDSKYEVSNFRIVEYNYNKEISSENNPASQDLLFSQVSPELVEELSEAYAIEDTVDRENSLLQSRENHVNLLNKLQSGATLQTNGISVTKKETKIIYEIEQTIGVIENIYLPEIDPEKYPRDEEWLDKLNEKYGGNPTLEY